MALSRRATSIASPTPSPRSASCADCASVEPAELLVLRLDRDLPREDVAEPFSPNSNPWASCRRLASCCRQLSNAARADAARGAQSPQLAVGSERSDCSQFSDRHVERHAVRHGYAMTTIRISGGDPSGRSRSGVRRAPISLRTTRCFVRPTTMTTLRTYSTRYSRRGWWRRPRRRRTPSDRKEDGAFGQGLRSGDSSSAHTVSLHGARVARGFTGSG